MRRFAVVLGSPPSSSSASPALQEKFPKSSRPEFRETPTVSRRSVRIVFVRHRPEAAIVTADERIALLAAVRDGKLGLEEAERLLSAPEPVADLGFAHVDLDRRRRCGFPEVVFGQGKTPEQIVAIMDRIAADGHGCLATRLDADSGLLLKSHFAGGVHDPIARTFWLAPKTPEVERGRVAVVSAGTSDLPVAKEAFNTAQAMGCRTELVVDVGVAGLHRILSKRKMLEDQDVVVVVAGMEGALPSVVAGLVACPVIAVPTSVGYGASFHGMAALLGMLSSCAANVTVVNIDAGFCGGYVAALIAKRAAA
jgi:NCAIR mutase (PurE)-related protein